MRALARYNTATVRERVASAYPPDGGTHPGHGLCFFDKWRALYGSAADKDGKPSVVYGQLVWCDACMFHYILGRDRLSRDQVELVYGSHRRSAGNIVSGNAEFNARTSSNWK
jgi:hypothetical protein